MKVLLKSIERRDNKVILYKEYETVIDTYSVEYNNERKVFNSYNDASTYFDSVINQFL